jgi:hypothetical protein
MATTHEIKVLISDSQIERAAKIAEAMTADQEATGHGDAPWDAQDVLNAAVARGLAALEKAYRL